MKLSISRASQPKKVGKNKSLPSNQRFSKTHLIILLVIFAICGGIYTFASHAATGDGSVGVYRLFQSTSGEHFYTTSEGETRNLVPKAGFSSDGFGFFAWADGNNGRQPVYRLASPGTNGKHMVTMSVAEKDALVKGGWSQEGIAFYAYSTAGAGRIPAYRLVGTNFDHLITTSGYERDQLVAAKSYKSEGIAFYVSDGANAPAQNVHLPSGALDSSSCSTLVGWALDGDNLSATVRVDAYVQGVGISTGPTNVDRPDISRIFYAPGKHGYNITIPAQWLDGKAHGADVYAINVDSQGKTVGANNKIGHREFACDASNKDHMPEILAQRAAEAAAAQAAAAQKAAQDAAYANAIRLASMQTLQLGSTGPAVAALQQRLANRGFWILADGNFSANTEHWVRAFSIEIGLGNIGTVDGRTYNALNQAEADNWHFDPNDPQLAVLMPPPPPPVVINRDQAQPQLIKCGTLMLTVAQCEAFRIFLSHIPPAQSPPATPVVVPASAITAACRGYANDNGVYEIFGISATYADCYNQHNNNLYPNVQHIDWYGPNVPNKEIWTRIDNNTPPVVVQRNPALEVGVCRWFQSNGILRADHMTQSQCTALGPSSQPSWSYN